MDDLFKIYKIDETAALKINSVPNTPHQHNFEELIIGLKGQITHFIDYAIQKFKAPFITFVTKGKIHRIEPQIFEGKCELWVLRFKSEFIPEATFQLYNHYHDQANITVGDLNRLHRITTLCKLMDEEMNEKKPELGIIKQLLASLFTMIECERQKINPAPAKHFSNQNTTFKNFLNILEENYKRPKGVNFYAEKLFMTARNLNLITQNILHQTVSEIIETRKLTEAKNLLFTTSKSIAEIGFELGYTDKAYFTSVFKKKSGLTPSEFREEMKSIIS